MRGETPAQFEIRGTLSKTGSSKFSTKGFAALLGKCIRFVGKLPKKPGRLINASGKPTRVSLKFLMRLVPTCTGSVSTMLVLAACTMASENDDADINKLLWRDSCCVMYSYNNSGSIC